MDAIAAPVHVAGAALQVPASIGIAIGTGLEDREELLERADKAMYSTKHAGRERYVIYGAAMRPGHQGGMRVRPHPSQAPDGNTVLDRTAPNPHLTTPRARHGKQASQRNSPHQLTLTRRGFPAAPASPGLHPCTGIRYGDHTRTTATRAHRKGWRIPSWAVSGLTGTPGLAKVYQCPRNLKNPSPPSRRRPGPAPAFRSQRCWASWPWPTRCHSWVR